MDLDDEQDSPTTINVVPLIDVLFALLTFFIMSTLFLTRQEGLPVNLPRASTSQQSQIPTRITITVDSQSQVSLNKKPTTIDALTSQVRSLVGANPEAVVVINADEGVGHGKVVAVMDKVRQVKGAKLAIATQKE